MVKIHWSEDGLENAEMTNDEFKRYCDEIKGKKEIGGAYCKMSISTDEQKAYQNEDGDYYCNMVISFDC